MYKKNLIKRSIVPGVLNIYSNVKKIHYFSYGDNLKYNLIPFQKTPLVVKFFVKSNSHFKKQDYLKKFNIKKFCNDISFHKGNNFVDIFFKKKLSFNKFLYANIRYKSNEIVLEVNKFYYNLFKFKIESIIPPGKLLADLVYVMLLENNFLSVHSSAFATHTKKGFLILAPHNVGKTLTVIKAIKDKKYCVSEDLTVVKKGVLYSVPYTSTYDHELTSKLDLSLLSYFISYPTKPFGSKFPNSMIDCVKLNNVIILEKDKLTKSILFKRKDYRKILNKIIVLFRLEFKYLSNDILLSILYLKDNFLEILSKEKELIVENIIRFPKRIFIIRSNNPHNYYKMIKKLDE